MPLTKPSFFGALLAGACLAAGPGYAGTEGTPPTPKAPKDETLWTCKEPPSDNERNCQSNVLRTLILQMPVGSAAPKVDTGSGVDTDKFTAVATAAQGLARRYQILSGNRQDTLDISSWSTAVGAVGSIVSSDIGPETAGAWGGLALGSVIYAQFTAQSPRRDLYYGGMLGVDLVSARYQSFERAARRFRAARDQKDLADAENNCSELTAQVREMDGWAEGSLDKAILAAEAKNLADACAAFNEQKGDLDDLGYVIEAWEADLPYLFAADLISLDAAIRQRDFALRSAPSETLTTLASIPFTTVSTLLTGQDGAKAIATLKSQAAFSKLNLRLSSLDLPAAPTVAFATQAISQSVNDRPKADRSGQPVTAGEATAAVNAMTKARDALERARPKMIYRLALVRPLMLAAQADRLTFDYDAASRTVSVSLSPPVDSQTPQVGGAP